MSDVPHVDINAPLPETDQPVEDTVMMKAKREWSAGIVVFSIFILVLGGVWWGYYRNSQIINSQMTNNKTEIVAAIPKETPPPTASQLGGQAVFAVWNGSGVAGAAGKMAEKLKSEGYEVVETKNAPKEQVGSTVEIGSKVLDQKEKILGLVEGSVYKPLIDESLEYSVKIIIGK